MTRLNPKFIILFLIQCNQCSIGSTLVNSELEKSDKAKMKFITLFLLQCNQCLIGSTLVDSELEKSDKVKTEVHNLVSSSM